jgi:ATPase family protein associated with various cellular activities (AAA)
MASHWNALLLLDEADVFVAQRTMHDLHRNSLVCMFLRTLEYYQGLLFLTTNRVENIDDAISSRIHVMIKYKELSSTNRRELWEAFLDKGSPSSRGSILSKQEMLELSRKKLNGREVCFFLKILYV